MCRVRKTGPWTGRRGRVLCLPRRRILTRRAASAAGRRADSAQKFAPWVSLEREQRRNRTIPRTLSRSRRPQACTASRRLTFADRGSGTKTRPLGRSTRRQGCIASRAEPHLGREGNVPQGDRSLSCRRQQAFSKPASISAAKKSFRINDLRARKCELLCCLQGKVRTSVGDNQAKREFLCRARCELLCLKG